jgi:hypothetical protein
MLFKFGSMSCFYHRNAISWFFWTRELLLKKKFKIVNFERKIWWKSKRKMLLYNPENQRRNFNKSEQGILKCPETWIFVSVESWI